MILTLLQQSPHPLHPPAPTLPNGGSDTPRMAIIGQESTLCKGEWVGEVTNIHAPQDCDHNNTQNNRS